MTATTANRPPSSAGPSLKSPTAARQQQHQHQHQPPPAPATDTLQSIPARHGTATFVPRGMAIRVINTYGKQVVAVWVFALHGAPEEAKEEKEGGEEEEETKAGAEEKEGGGKVEEVQEETHGEAESKKKTEAKAEDKSEAKAEDKTKEAAKAQKDDDASGTAKEDAGTADAKTDENEKSTTEPPKQEPGKDGTGTGKKTWAAVAGSYIPSIRRGKGGATTATDDGAPDPDESVPPSAEAKKGGWASYIPTLRRGKKASNTDDEEEAAQANSKRWSEYIPSGKAYSSYLPSKETMSAFAASHYRDPNKSYAEQLYDFSKTPVGAAGLSGIMEPQPWRPSKAGVAR